MGIKKRTQPNHEQLKKLTAILRAVEPKKKRFNVRRFITR